MSLWSVLVLSTLAASQSLESRRYLIAIGNNAAPEQSDEGRLDSLDFADDDAAAVYELFAPLSTKAFLLSVLDAQTQKVFPSLAEQSLPPRFDVLERIVAELGAQLHQDRKAGFKTELVFFFSGHGSRRGDAPFLTLSDRPLTQDLLYQAVLASLPADLVHVFVDACYAAAVVRPRDGDSATAVELSDNDIAQWYRRRSLQQFPNVGAVVATTANQRAHEWGEYQRGVFTHQLLSGLRGAADINADRRIEYTELEAFLLSANAGVSDARAKLDVLVEAPRINLRAAIIDLRRAKNLGWLVGEFKEPVKLSIAELGGKRLVDLHVEAKHRLALALPAQKKLRLHTGGADGTFSLKPGKEVAVQDIELNLSRSRSRGGLDETFRSGLFQRAYGTRYYQGYLDSRGGLGVSVASRPKVSDRKQMKRRKISAWTSFGASVALGLVAGLSAGLSIKARAEFENTSLQREAADARASYDTYRFTALGTGLGALVTTATGLGLWPWKTP